MTGMISPFTIGCLSLTGHTVLAPLAGITHQPFRRIVKACGTALVCSEMVSAKGLQYASEKTYALLSTHPDERPVSIQIFGADPECMAFAASSIEARGDADLIDINMGCSVKKVVKTGAGVALMQTPEKAEAIMRAVRSATSLPFTIKIRTGWDKSGRQAMEIADRAQRCGVDAVAIHPRIASQGFRGEAEWKMIERVKRHISIPVIGNGDITTAEAGVRMIEETGCDAVMVGRGAMTNPFLLADIDHLLQGGQRPERSLDDIFAVMMSLLETTVEHFGETVACKMMRSRLPWFVKGWPECSRFRRQLTSIASKKEALDLIHTYRHSLDFLSFSPPMLDVDI